MEVLGRLTAATATGSSGCRGRLGPPGVSNAPLQPGKPVLQRIWGSAPGPTSAERHGPTRNRASGSTPGPASNPVFWKPPRLPESHHHHHRGSASSKAYSPDSSATRPAHVQVSIQGMDVRAPCRYEVPHIMRSRVCTYSIPGRCTATSRPAFHGHARVCASRRS